MDANKFSIDGEFRIMSLDLKPQVETSSFANYVNEYIRAK